MAYSDLSIGLMFAMFGYIWFIMTPVQDILTIQYAYASASAAINRINKILDLKCEKNGVEKLPENSKKIDISIQNLNFSYKEDKATLKDVTFNIKSGDKVAIIGASGSGKTTIAHLISGFYSKD